MNACDKKLKSSLMEAMELDDARLEREMKNEELHVFSEGFEKRMEEVMKVEERKRKPIRFFRFAAVFVMIALLSGGVILVGSDELRASAINIDILAWLGKFFTVEEGVDERRDEDVLFDESQLGYVPEGFEMVLEEELFSRVYYKYQNEAEEYLIIRVMRDKLMSTIDNEEIETEIKLNASGYEYTVTYKNDDHDAAIMWKDQNDIYYFISGTLEHEELIKIMDGITY